MSFLYPVPFWNSEKVGFCCNIQLYYIENFYIDQQNIAALINQQPDITCLEIVETLNLPVSIDTVWRYLQKQEYRRKKKSLYASERERSRCGTEEKRVERPYSGFKANNLVFLDESGCNTDMTRRQAYSLGGSRAVDSAPLSKPRNTTILSHSV